MLEMFLTISFNGRDQSCMCFWLAEHDIRFNTYQKKKQKKNKVNLFSGPGIVQELALILCVFSVLILVTFLFMLSQLY